MPYARLTLNRTDLPRETVDRAAAIVTERLAADLDKIAHITVVQVELVPESTWYIGAAPVTGVGGHLSVSLTENINTDEQKGDFIAKTYAALDELLGGLAPIFYIEVDEVSGFAWGYNGIQQNKHQDAKD